MPIPTRPDADAGQHSLNEQDTTAKVERATSWGRCRGGATQRAAPMQGGCPPHALATRALGDNVERKLHWH